MIKSIFEALAGILKIILIAVKGDQPKRSEIEEATNQLEKENKELQNELEKKIKEKKNEENH